MILQQLKTIIAEQLEISEDDITLESDLIKDFDADSLDLVDIVMSIEDVFGVEIPEESIDEIKYVSDVVAFIEENKD